MGSDELLELKCEAAELRDRILFYDTRVQELERQLFEAQIRLGQAEGDTSRLERHLEEAGQPVLSALAEDEVRTIAGTLEATREELDRERTRVDELTALLQQSEQRYDEIVNELDEAYDALEQSHRKELQNIQSDLDRVRTLEATMQERIAEKDKAIEELMEGLHTQSAKADAQLTEVRREVDDLKAQLARATQEAAFKLPEEARKALEKERSDSLREKQGLEEKVRDLSRQLELRKQDLDRLEATAQTRADQLQERDQEMARLRERAESREREAGETLKELRAVQAELEAARDRSALDAVRTENEELKAELAKARQKLKEHDSVETVALKGRLEAAEKELEALRENLKTSRAARTQSEEEAERFRIRAEEFRRRLAKLEGEASKVDPALQHKVVQAQARAEALEEEAAELRARVAESEKSLAAQQAMAKEVRLKHEARLKEAQEKINSVQEFARKQTSAAAKTAAGETRISGLEKERADLASRLAEAEEALESAQAARGAAETELKAVEARETLARASKKDLQTRIDELEKKTSSLEADVRSRDEQLKDADSRAQELRQAKQTAEEQAQSRLEELRRSMEERIEEVRKSAADEAAASKVNALRVQIDFLKKKEREWDKSAIRIRDLEKRVSDAQARTEEERQRAEMVEKASQGLEGVLARQKEGYEKQLASIQADLDSARERIHSLEEQRQAPVDAGAQVLKGRIEELIRERAETQAQVKSQQEMFADFKERLENIQKLIRLKDEQIGGLEKRIEEMKQEERDAARKTMRRFKTKMGLPVPEGRRETDDHEEKIRKIRDEVAHGREEFDKKIREIQQAAVSAPPKSDWPVAPAVASAGKQELEQITRREGTHTRLEGYDLTISRFGLLAGRKNIGTKLHGISEDGMRVGLSEAVQPGDRLRVIVRVKQFDDTIEIEAEVAWCREMQFRSVWDAELRYSKIKDEDRRRIKRWLDFYASLGKPPR